MKKVRLNKTLKLNKSMVSKLNDQEMTEVNGKGGITLGMGCFPPSDNIFCHIESVRATCITVNCDK